MISCREWTLKCNCSTSARQLGFSYLVLCLVSLLLALIFAARGASYVLAFAMLELAAVGFAFFLYARRASDRERVALIDNYLLVALIRAERPVMQLRLDTRCTHVESPASDRDLVCLRANGVRVEVGRFLTE